MLRRRQNQVMLQHVYQIYHFRRCYSTCRRNIMVPKSCVSSFTGERCECVRPTSSVRRQAMGDSWLSLASKTSLLVQAGHVKPCCCSCKVSAAHAVACSENSILEIVQLYLARLRSLEAKKTHMHSCGHQMQSTW